MTETVHRLGVRVYYEDTDFSGVVYHANYLRFLERGRTEFLRDLGIEQAKLVDEAGQSLAFAVRHMTIDFAKPARMDDVLVVETATATHGGASLLLHQRILRDDALLVTASVKIAMVGGGRARRFPAAIVATFDSRRTRTNLLKTVQK